MATALLAVSTIPVSAASAGSGPVLVVSNPAPNDYLRRDRHIVTGVAYDPVATSSTGVDQVTVFLGDRDAGGTFCRCGVPGGYLGTAMLGLPNTQGTAKVQFATAGWSLKMKSLGKGAYTLFVYARSSVTGRETSFRFRSESTSHRPR